MSLGIRETAEKAVRSGFRHILFKAQPESETVAVDEFLRSLAPVRSPYLQNGRLSEAAQRGKRLFEDPRVGCATCHPSPLFTTCERYDVGTANRSDRSRKAFDTPTLVEVWRTPPYLHDGSQSTIQSLLTVGNSRDQHGATSHLTPDEIEDLAAYVMSL
jgi:cytochrome c peroxidase